MICIQNDAIQILLILFLISTQQNIHGCCDGYKWDSVDNDCVSMFFFQSTNMIFISILFYKLVKKTWLYTSNSGTVFAECSPGFTGVGCSIKCFYPLFGENCLRICSCSPVEFCDFIFGCLKRKFIRVRGCMCRWILVS